MRLIYSVAALILETSIARTSEIVFHDLHGIPRFEHEVSDDLAVFDTNTALEVATRSIPTQPGAGLGARHLGSHL